MQPKELLKRMKTRQPPIVLDVRSGIEFRNGHIPGALHSPALKILLRLAPIPSDRNTELVLTCDHGPRAQLPRDCLVSSVIGMWRFSQGTWLVGGKPGILRKSNQAANF